MGRERDEEKEFECNREPESSACRRKMRSTKELCPGEDVKLGDVTTAKICLSKRAKGKSIIVNIAVPKMLPY